MLCITDLTLGNEPGPLSSIMAVPFHVPVPSSVNESLVPIFLPGEEWSEKHCKIHLLTSSLQMKQDFIQIPSDEPTEGIISQNVLQLRHH